MSEYVLVESQNGILTISLNRQDALNALTFEMLHAIEEAVGVANRDRQVRTVVLKGNGKCFSSGDDLVDMASEGFPAPEQKIDEFLQGYPQTCKALRDCRVPVVASIHKYALGAGLELALAADFVLAAKGTKVGLPFALRGFSSGTTQLPRLTNRLFASKLLLAGEMVSCEDLDRFGLIYGFFELEDLASETAALAEKLAGLPTVSLTLMKQQMGKLNVDEETAWLLQSHSTVSSVLTADHAEGKQAFQEKRDPIFNGN